MGVAGVAAEQVPVEQTLFLEAVMLYEANKYREACELLEQIITLNPENSEYHRWLGKSYGRTAEQSGWIMAIRYATKARHSFETAVTLDETNARAMRDLLEFYVEAPAILGGGLGKARQLAKRLLALDPSFSEEVKELLSKED